MHRNEYLPDRRNDYISDYRDSLIRRDEGVQQHRSSRGGGYNNGRGGGYNTMSSSNGNKAKTTTQTNLPDGSKVKEYIVEEANADGSKTITTTTVRTTKEKRTLRDGSQVTEDVSTTTTATRHIQAPVRSPHQHQHQQQQQQDGGNVLENAMKSVGSFLDMFVPGTATANAPVPAVDATTVQDEISTLGNSWEAQQRPMCWPGVSQGQRQWTQQRQAQQQQQQQQQAQLQARPPSSSSRAVSKTAGELRRENEQQWGGGGGRETPMTIPPSPGHGVNQTDHQYPPQPIGSGNRHYGEDSPNNNTAHHYVADNFNDDEEDGASFTVYEDERCQTQLPTFHKCVPGSVGSSKKSGGSVGRTIMKTLTPTRRPGTPSSSHHSQDDVSHRSGRDSQSSGRRLNSNLDDNRGGMMPPRGIYAPSPEQQQQYHQQQSSPHSPHSQQTRGRGRLVVPRQSSALDPEVVNAIDMIRQRSKSPPKGPRGYLPPLSPVVPSPFIEDQQLAQQKQYNQRPPTPQSGGRYDNSSPRGGSGGQVAMMNYNSNNGGGQQLPPHLANHNEWDAESRDERDDFGGIPPPKPAATRSALRLELRSPTPTSMKKKSEGSKQMTMKRMQGKVPIIPPPTLVNYGQSLLTTDTFTSVSYAPKIVIHKTNAIITSDRYVHFYSLSNNKWVQTTSVSLPNTQGLSFAICNNTAVVGVPYDRNSRGVLTGAAYIFERDAKTQTWYQVKKIVPKNVQEFSNVGYSVDISDNVVCVGVPELGGGGEIISSGNGGSVYVYQRAEQYKWMPMGHLTMSGNSTDPNILSPAGGLLAPTTINFGTILALKHKILVVSNYSPEDLASETSLFVYEYDVSLKKKWRLIQTDLLSTELQRRNFGSHVALSSNGEGIFIGCHSDVNPTEILYYKRKAHVDMYGNRSYQLQQIITLQEKCNIADFCVDASDNFIVSTLNSNRVYVYQQMHDLVTLEDQGWRLVAKVCDSNLERQMFGKHVGFFGDSILVGTKGNVYAYSLDKWLTEVRKNPPKPIKPPKPVKKSSSSSSNSSAFQKLRGIFVAG